MKKNDGERERWVKSVISGAGYRGVDNINGGRKRGSKEIREEMKEGKNT